MESMRSILNFGRLGRERRRLSESRDVAPGRSAGYELKDRDLGKIHKAASVGDQAKLIQLIKQRKDINETDKKLRTALHVACAVGRDEMVQLLVDYDAELNLLDGEGRTALMKAVQGHHADCVRVLLKNSADAELADRDGNTALHFSANLLSVNVVQLLLTHGVHIDASNQEGLTPLSLAVREGHGEMVQLLLEEGADVNVTDRENRTPLMIAEARGLTAITQMLLKQNKQLSAKASFSHREPASDRSKCEAEDDSESYPEAFPDVPVTVTSLQTFDSEAHASDDNKPLADESRASDDDESLADESCASDDDESLADESRASDDDESLADESCASDDNKSLADESRASDDDESLADESRASDDNKSLADESRASDDDESLADESRASDDDESLADESCASDDDESLADEFYASDDNNKPLTIPKKLRSSFSSRLPNPRSDTLPSTDSSNNKKTDFMPKYCLDDYSFSDSDDDSVEEQLSPRTQKFSETPAPQSGSDELSTNTSALLSGLGEKEISTDEDENEEVAEPAASTGKMRDFMAELGLEDEELSSPWESEDETDSASESGDEQPPDEEKEGPRNSGPLPREETQSYEDSDHHSDVYEGAEDDTAPSSLNSSPLLSLKPQSHEDADYDSDRESDNDIHEWPQDEPVSPEPNADRTSESEPDEEPEEVDNDVKEVYERAQADLVSPEQTDSEVFKLKEEAKDDESNEDADWESNNDIYEAEDDLVFPEPNADTSSDSEEFDLEEETEGISDDEEILEEDKETIDEIINSSPLPSPKPQIHEDPDYDSDRDSDNDIHEWPQDEPVSPEPNADRTSESEPDEEPEEVDNDVKKVYERAQADLVSPEQTDSEVFQLKEEAKDDESNEDADWESNNDIYEAEDDLVFPEPNAATSSDSEEFDLEEETEGISDDEEILEEDTAPSSLNSSPLLLLKPQSHEDADYDSDWESDNDIHEWPQDEPVSPEPNADRTSESEPDEESEEVDNDVKEVYERAQADLVSPEQTDSEVFQLKEEAKDDESNEDADWESNNDIYEAEDDLVFPEPNAATSSDSEKFEEEPEGISDDEEILEEDKETIDEIINSSPLPSPKPQIHEDPDYDSDRDSDNDIHEWPQDEPVSPEPNADRTSESEPDEEPEEVDNDVKEVYERAQADLVSPEQTDSEVFKLKEEAKDDESNEDADWESNNDIYEAEDDLVFPEPNAATSSDSEEFDLEEETEGISDDEEILEEDTAPSSLNSSPLLLLKPQSHEDADYDSDWESDNDFHEWPQDEPVSPEPNADRTSESEPDEESEEVDNDVKEVYERAQADLVSPEQTDSEVFQLKEEAKDDESNEDADWESNNDIYEAEDDLVFPEPNAATSSDSEEFDLEEETEGISDDEEILEEDTAPSSLNSSPLLLLKPQSHEDADYDSDWESDNDFHEWPQDEPVSPEPNADRTSESEPDEESEEVDNDVKEVYERAQADLVSPEQTDSEVFQLKEEAKDDESNEDADWESNNDIYEAEDNLVFPEPNATTSSDSEEFDLEEETEGISDDEDILEEDTAPSSLNSSPLLSLKPQSHEDADYDSDWESDNDFYERAQDEPGSGQEEEQEAFCGDDGEMLEEKKENQGLEELNFFEDLTQSSDTASDDLESAASFMQDLDSRSSMKIQNILREYERAVKKLKNKNSYLSEKVKQLETEKVELNNSLDEVREIKPELQFVQMEVQMEVDHLKHQLKQEQEKQRQVTASYNATKDKLQRTEEQHQLQVREKQQMEFTLRNRELEMQTLVINMKQLEEEHSKTQELLAQERSARALQDELLHKQQEVKEENGDLLQQTSTLQEQIQSLKAELKRLQANSSLKESLLLESETLKEQLQDAKREAMANSNALSQTAFDCKHQLAALKSQLGLMTNNFENEKKARKTLEKEADSFCARLAAAAQEVEQWMAAKADAEKSLLRETEKSQRLEDRLRADGARHREEVSALSLKLSRAELENNRLENEQQRVTLQLKEKELLLDMLQREKEQLDKALQTQTELLTKTEAVLQLQLQDANDKCEAKEKALGKAQRYFRLSKQRLDYGERVSLVEDRNKELTRKTAELQDQVCTLEEQKACVLKDLDQLKEKLTQREDQCLQGSKRLNEKEEELAVCVQRLQEAQTALSASAASVKRLEEAVQRVETAKSTAEADLQMRYEKLKRKALNIREQKNDAETRLKQVETRLKQVETSLNQKRNANSELQRKLDSLHTMVKTTEKRLRDQDTTGDFIMNQDLQELVDRVTLRCRQLEKDNIELREEMSSLKRSEQRCLDELQELRRQTDISQRERSLIEERSRNELQHKLDQVNLFLKTQAASQKAQDQINANNAASMQSRLEQRIRELENEVSRVGSNAMDSLAIQTELDRYKSMYSEEILLRKSMAARLERTNTRLADTQSQLLTARTKYLIATSGLDMTPASMDSQQFAGDTSSTS